MQKETVLYTFVLSAELLMKIAVVLRFGEHPEGVNRALTNNHAIGIALHMEKEEGGVMLDSILGDVRSGDDVHSWEYDEVRHTLTGMVEDDPEKLMDACCMLVDDGQHRLAACEMLDGEQRGRWSFPVTTTVNLPVKQRIAIFGQQGKRKKLDPRLRLAQAHRVDRFKNRAEKAAYLAALELNRDPRSPLLNKIFFDQATRGRLPRDRHNLMSLFQYIKQAVGKTSSLHGYSIEEQVEIIVNFFVAAAAVWPAFWTRDGHPLARPLGIDTLLVLLSRQPRFSGMIGRDHSRENMERVLSLGKKFQWVTRADPASVNPGTLSLRLDDYLWKVEVSSRPAPEEATYPGDPESKPEDNQATPEEPPLQATSLVP